jgi:hypothetical protein
MSQALLPYLHLLAFTMLKINMNLCYVVILALLWRGATGGESIIVIVVATRVLLICSLRFSHCQAPSFVDSFHLISTVLELFLFFCPSLLLPLLSARVLSTGLVGYRFNATVIDLQCRFR